MSSSSGIPHIKMFEQFEQTMGAIWSTLKAVQAAIVKDSANHRVCSHSECVKTANLVAGALCRMDGMIGGLAASKLQELVQKTESKGTDRQDGGHAPPKGKPDGRRKWSAVVKDGLADPTPPSRTAIQWSTSRTFFLRPCDPAMVTRHINKLDFGQFLAKIIPNPDDPQQLAVEQLVRTATGDWKV